MLLFIYGLNQLHNVEFYWLIVDLQFFSFPSVRLNIYSFVIEGSSASKNCLDWDTRLDIALNAAQGKYPPT